VSGMLADEVARDAAREIRSEIDALPGVEAVVPRLEALAGH
jgi:hypothetical protein